MKNTFPCSKVIKMEGVMKQKLRTCIIIAACMALMGWMAGCAQNKAETGSQNNAGTETKNQKKAASNGSLDAEIETATRGCKVVQEGEENQQGSLTYKV